MKVARDTEPEESPGFLFELFQRNRERVSLHSLSREVVLVERVGRRTRMPSFVIETQSVPSHHSHQLLTARSWRLEYIHSIDTVP